MKDIKNLFAAADIADAARDAERYLAMSESELTDAAIRYAENRYAASELMLKMTLSSEQRMNGIKEQLLSDAKRAKSAINTGRLSELSNYLYNNNISKDRISAVDESIR